MQNLLNRFLNYVRFETRPDETNLSSPSSVEQMLFAEQLTAELEKIGMEEVTLDGNGYVMATLPSNNGTEDPVIGFIAHMDTSPEAPSANVNPLVHSNYDGNDIVLNKELDIVLSPSEFPELVAYRGRTIITSNGTTLLGADDKAGIAEIITACEHLIANPSLKHGKIRIAFTPDEEIGRGADNFNVKAFGADWAYTLDGGGIGELEYENFNAAAAAISIMGRSVHPGTAKDTMINSITLARELDELLPSAERPEHTSGYEGFFHLYDLRGTVEETDMKYIIRDHDPVKFSERKKIMNAAAEEIRKRYSSAGITLAIKDQYFNMKEIIEANYHTIEAAIDAYRRAGIEPVIKPVRGGTDGAKLSFMGLPCPNLFTGGHNYHGRYEYIPLQSMEKAVEVIINLCTSAKKPQK
ncbi:MAG: peptidase T [Bacteroidales bacterium]|nr:peptidase T [Bacteroidales bacterium]HOO65831.1 peptidase T [Bacteroidales bacterium]HPE23045.1 peptidase T [Bacteroidales bacterium]HPJ04652.1 peptidase T [Bacteroidales bacterium]HPQ63419.1 peptidase T [Bacteroidales bacterium]